MPSCTSLKLLYDLAQVLCIWLALNKYLLSEWRNVQTSWLQNRFCDFPQFNSALLTFTGSVQGLPGRYKFYSMNSLLFVVSSNYTIQVDSTLFACYLIMVRTLINGGWSGGVCLFTTLSITQARSPHSFMLGSWTTVYWRHWVVFTFGFWFRIVCLILIFQSPDSLLLCLLLCNLKPFHSNCSSGSSSLNNFFMLFPH